MKSQNLGRGLLAIALFLGLVFTSCSDKKDSSSETDDSSTTTIGTQGAENALAVGYPSTLALSLFPQTVDDGTNLVEDATVERSIREKTQDNIKRLSGKSECIDLSLFQQRRNGTHVSCYDFDSDLGPAEYSNGLKVGTTDGTNGAGEACMVSFARSEVDDTVQQVDKALSLVAGMLCQAKKKGLSKELAVDESLDLVEAFGEATGPTMPISVAKIQRLKDEDGAAVYRSDIELNFPDGKSTEVHLINSTTATSKKGVLWYIRPVDGGDPSEKNGDTNNSANKNFVMSINYELSTDEDNPRSKAELRRAAIIKTIDPVTENGQVNFEGLSEEATNQDVHAIKYLAFDVNPETNAGDLSYWMSPGGGYSESARGFLFSIDADADSGILSGCGVSGATANVSIRKAMLEPSEDNTLAPVRYWHPREPNNISDQKDPRYDDIEGFKITQQCFKQNEAGVYAIDTEKTTDGHGYDVIEVAETEVLPPEPPKDPIRGDFVPRSEP